MTVIIMNGTVYIPYCVIIGKKYVAFFFSSVLYINHHAGLKITLGISTYSCMYYNSLLTYLGFI